MSLSEIDIDKFNYIVIGSSFGAQPLLKVLSAKKENQILLVEGGDEEEKDFSEQLTKNNEMGDWGYNPEYWASHWIRVYGGTSRRWSGMCAPLDKYDFEKKMNVPSWPISRFDIEKYYEKSAKFVYRNINILKTQKNLTNSLEYKPYSLPKKLRTFYEVKKDFFNDNVRILLNTHLIKLNFQNNFINEIILSYKKQSANFLIKNQKIILCCGGLGNTQILLQNLIDENNSSIFWNRNILGKNLMEHPHHYVGHGLISIDLINKKPLNFGPHTNGFSISEHVRKKYNLLNCTFEPRIFNEKIDSETKKIKKFYEKKFNKELIYCKIFSRSEQSPNQSSHIKLNKKINEIGMRMLDINFKISEFDKDCLFKNTNLFGEELIRNQLGVIKVDPRESFNPRFGGGHTMGTTKMGFSFNDSIVDKNCKVHGVRNLYISGSSIFTSGGAANPTLTIAALSYRLGYHLLNYE